jgi:nicotinamide mononucleotide (NMN) deamidase PncC
VGTVYIGLAIMDKADVRHFIFKGTREEVRTSTVDAALQFVIDYMDWER